MEEFKKLRNIALPLSCCSPPTHGFKVGSVSDNGDCLSSVETKTDSFVQQPEDFDFQKFAEKMLILNDNELNSILEDMDAKHKVSIQDPKTEEVVTATETLVACILHAVGEIDPRFKSSCINSGSFYDDLKVGSADEFDFVARIESLSKKGVLEARKSERKRGFVYLAVVDKGVQDQFREFLTKPDDDPCLRTEDVILEVNAFHEHFIELNYSAMEIIDIPDNFIPSNKSNDLEESNYSWMPYRHGPCATLYFTYICQNSPDAVSIDLDIAPSIAYPGNDYEPPVIKCFWQYNHLTSFSELFKISPTHQKHCLFHSTSTGLRKRVERPGIIIIVTLGESPILLLKSQYFLCLNLTTQRKSYVEY